MSHCALHITPGYWPNMIPVKQTQYQPLLSQVLIYTIVSAKIQTHILMTRPLEHKSNAVNHYLWNVMAEGFSALDLCSDGRVVRMWVRTASATIVLMSLSKTL